MQELSRPIPRQEELSAAGATAPARVLAWDWPTRAFHWLLVALLVNAWASNKWGAANPAWHTWNGYAILVLIVFRVLWGFFGGSTARFSSFLSLRRIWPYASRMFGAQAQHYLGHNPMGGWMVLGLLAILFAQGALGLFASDSDRVVIEGPLAARVSDATVDWASRWHVFGFNLILWLAGLHVAAVIFYETFKRQRLVAAMFAGYKKGGTYQDAARAEPGSAVAATLCLVAALVLVFGAIMALGGRVL